MTQPELFWMPSTEMWHCSVCLAPTYDVHSWEQCARYAVKRANQLYDRTIEVEAMAAQYLERCLRNDAFTRERTNV